MADPHHLVRGEDQAQILDFMVERHGDFVRHRPTLEAGTLARWLGPFVLFALAALAIGMLLPPAGMVMHEAEARVQRLAARHDSAGDSAADGRLIARSMAALEPYPETAQAHARALDLSPPNPQLLADQADLLAAAQGFSFVGEPLRLIERALQIEPEQPRALALAGAAAFERGDFAAAASHWRRARSQAPAESEFAHELARRIERAEAHGAPAR